MPSAASILYYLVHPSELRSILQWKVWHNPVHERDHTSEPPSLSACFDYLDLTSRSFSAVIQELNHELLIPICLFYLSLRGLDTIEDDMTISLQKKEPLLRGFDKFLEQDGWTFTENGPNEKDRELLVNFHYVVIEFKKLKPEYKIIIKDITKRMGDGMADYANNAEHNKNGVNTIKDYELYCHYVAGLVGEGLTRLFVQGNSAKPQLMDRPDLYESMGQFLQQTNIIRDIHEDFEDGRRFWPKEVWSKYVNNWDEMFLLENREKALQCSSEMVAMALERAPDCMFYLAGIKEQSVFNFAAIPQSMAIATLELCFRNPAIFEKNVKITKGAACRLMMQSSQNLQILYGAFRTYARIIHHKNDPRDPNFLRISVACGKIEQFIESVFPSQDPRAIVPQPEEEAKKNADGQRILTEAQKKREQEERSEAWRDVAIMGTLISAIIVGLSFAMLFLAQKLGARFDLAWDQLKSGILVPDMDKASQQIAAERAATAAASGAGAAGHHEL